MGFAPLDYGQKLANALPNAAFKTITKAGHFPHIEQPDALVARIEKFAGQLGQTSTKKLESAR